MRRLILLRHAKSDWPDGVADPDRPLAPRGQEAAPKMAAYLAAQGLLPDRVLVSPARRTQETWALVAESVPARAETVPEIYEAPPERILAAIRRAPEEAGTLLVVGHNPGIGELAAALVGEGPRKLRARAAGEFPTAAFAVIDFEGESWAALEPGTGRLERFVRPRDIDPELAG
jgi:phosphohistidine phosphatase